MQGLRNQTLLKIPEALHKQFHATLVAWKGGKYARGRGGKAYEGMDQQEIIQDLYEFYKSADGGAYREFLPQFWRAVEETINGCK